MQTLTADMFPSSVVGSVAGLVGAAGSLGGVVFSLIVGEIITNYGYSYAFGIAGVLHPLAFLVLLVMIPKVQLQESAATP